MYRTVGEAEFKQIEETGKFDAGRNSLGGKFFAENEKDANTWGQKLEGEGNFGIVKIMCLLNKLISLNVGKI